MNKTNDSVKNLLGANKFKDIKTGWNIKVFQKIKDGEKTRVQAFEGTVIARKHGDTPSGSITVRRVHGGFGVEKVFPIFLPTIEKVEVVKRAKMRRSKIYFLRDKTAKEIRRKVRHEEMEAKNTETTEETATE